jgi:uncharacterized protein
MRRRSDDALVFMAKWPEPGRAKTRLSPPLSPAAAAALARGFLLDTLTEASGRGADRLIAFAPRQREAEFRALLGPDVGLFPAEAPDLGGALQEAQAAAFAAGYRRVALCAADMPHLDGAVYERALAALAAADVALGPCGDGGYYLLAATRPTPALFQSIAWSTEVVAAQTRARATAVGLRLALLEAEDDIDTAADLLPLLERLRRRPGAGHTLAVLEAAAAALKEAV